MSGGSPNLIGIGLIHTVLGVKITFIQWMQCGLPLALGMFGVVFVVLATMFPSELGGMRGAGLLFLLPINFSQRKFTTSWQDATQIDWGTVLLFVRSVFRGIDVFQRRWARASV